MQIQEMVGIIAGIIGISGYIPYTIQVLTGQQKPQRITWFIWTIVSFLVFFSYDFSGANNAIRTFFVYSIGPLIIFILSIKYGTGLWSTFDKIALLGALVGGIMWFSTGNPLLGLLAGSMIDISGFLPTLRSVYRDSNSENKIPWGIWFFANTLNLFAVETFSEFHIFFPPLYLCIGSGMVFLLLFRKK